MIDTYPLSTSSTLTTFDDDFSSFLDEPHLEVTPFCLSEADEITGGGLLKFIMTGDQGVVHLYLSQEADILHLYLEVRSKGNKPNTTPEAWLFCEDVQILMSTLAAKHGLTEKWAADAKAFR